MPIQPQPLPLQFAGGIETKTDSKQVPVTQLLNLENATFIKGSTLAKRNGYESLSLTVEEAGRRITNAVGLGVRSDELVLFDGERCYSRRESTDTWVDADEAVSVEARDRPIARTGTEQTIPDHAISNGIMVVAWEDSRGGVWCSVLDAISERILVASTQLDSTGISPRCVAVGEVLHVYWAQPSSNRLYVAVVNPATPSLTPTGVVLTNDIDATNPVYDACPTGTVLLADAPAAIAWAQNGGGYRVGYVHPAGVLGSPLYGLPSVATWADTVTGPIAVTFDTAAGAKLAVAWCDTSPSVRWLNPSNLLSSSGTVALSATSATWKRITLEVSGVSATSKTLAWWAGEVSGARDDLSRLETGEVDSDGTIITASTARVLRGHGLISRAFYDDGHIYAAVGHAVQFFPYVAVVRISAETFGGASGTTTVARLLPGSFAGLSTRKHVASVHAFDPDALAQSRKHTLCLTYRVQLDSENGDQFGETAARLASLDFDHVSAYQTAQLGRGLYLASACPMHYDGLRWAEQGFHCAPDVPSGVTLVAEGGAGAIVAGTYGYKLVYEEIDAQGEWHPGPVSVAQNITNTGKKVTVTIPTYRLSTKPRVRIGVFRSLSGDDSTYYRVSSLDPAATGDNGYVLNDATADTVTFVDNLPDTTAATREPLYTNGGILSNDPTPMRGDVIAGGKNRLFSTDPSDPHVVRFSKELTQDDTAVEWPVQLAQRVDPYGGDIVGIGVMDEAVYVFCETAIYFFGGPGPDADGGLTSQNAFTPSTLLTSDVGCKAPKSICQTPNGIVFQSSKGIKLLGRDRQVIDIGAPVYAFNDQVITRATLMPDRHQVLFLTDDGYTLLWDYERGQWSKFTNHEGYDATVVNGAYVYLRTDGRVFRETPGLYRDDNSQIPMRIETAWIKATGYLQGWQRILFANFIGSYKSAHTLGVRYRLDYNDGWSTRYELAVNSNYNPSLYGAGSYGEGAYGGPGGDTSRYQRRIHLNQRCQAIQFRIEDIEATGDFGASFELSELLLIGGVLGPAFQPGAARSD